MTSKKPLIALLPFWVYVTFFKLAAGLHYTIFPVLGERILPIWVAGLAIGIGSLIQLIFDVPAGFILDRFGYIRVLLVSSFAFLLGALVFVFNFGIATYFISLAFATAGWLFYTPGINAYTLAKAPAEEGGRYMGLQHACASLGIVLATLVLVFFVHAPVWILAIFLVAMFSISLAALASAEKDHGSLADITARHPRHSYYVKRRYLHEVMKAMQRLDPASAILAVENLTGAIFYGVIWFVVPLLVASEMQGGILGIGLSVFDLAVVMLGAALGKLADRHSKKMLIFMGLLLFSIAGVFLGFNLNLLFLLIGFAATTGDEMASASLWSWLESIDRRHSEDGLVNGAITFFEDIGWTIGPILGGIFFEWVGPSLAIVFGAVPIFMTWLFSLVFLRGKTEPLADPLPLATHSLKPIRHRHKK